jgi:hypothetical protein
VRYFVSNDTKHFAMAAMRSGDKKKLKKGRLRR